MTNAQAIAAIHADGLTVDSDLAEIEDSLYFALDYLSHEKATDAARTIAQRIAV